MLEPRPPIRTGLPRLPVSPFHPCRAHYPGGPDSAYVDCFPVRAAFPAAPYWSGRQRLAEKPSDQIIDLAA